MSLVTGFQSAAFVVLALAACSPPEGQSAPTELIDAGSPTDNTGVYTGTVGGKPDFMVTFQTLHAQPFTVVSITQRGADIGAFGGGGLSAAEQHFNFESGWPGGGGQAYANGLLDGANRGAAILTGTWDIGERMVGQARRQVATEPLIDFDLTFDPISLAASPAGAAIPSGRYDIMHDGNDIGDFNVETAGSGSGAVTWPGAAQACEIVASPGVRAPGTQRNVWQIQFNTDVNCTPPVWSVGYGVASSGGGLTFELFGSRQLANHGRPAPTGEQDAMHIQLRRR